MRQVFIPAYEAATQQMFSQISSSLTSMERDSQAENGKLIMALSDQISTLASQVTTLSSELASIKKLVQNQSFMNPSQSSQQSQNTPDPTAALREEILALISETNYSVAFTKALSASSAEIAVFCCKHADISSLLDNDNSILSQPILLCLMQQLGSVLAMTQVEADLWMIAEWLQDIAVSIIPTDNSIKNHVSDIMNSVIENIHSKLNNAGGDGKSRRKLQMLVQVIRGVGY